MHDKSTLLSDLLHAKIHYKIGHFILNFCLGEEGYLISTFFNVIEKF